RGLPRLHLRGRHDRRHRSERGRAVHRLLLREVPGGPAGARRPGPGHLAGSGTRARRRREGRMNRTEASAGAPSLTYAAAGVDTAAGDRAVELMKEAVAATHGPQVLG